MYTGAANHVDIICKDHDVFSQIVSNHLSGHGCPSCKKKSEYKVYEFLRETLPGVEIIHDRGNG